MRGVMDDHWLEQANEVLDRYEHDPTRAWSATDVVAEREGAVTLLPSFCMRDGSRRAFTGPNHTVY